MVSIPGKIKLGVLSRFIQFKHILLFSFNGFGMARMRRKPSPIITHTHSLTPSHSELQYGYNHTVTRSGCWGFLLRLLPITETTLEYSLGPFILPRKPSLHVQAI